MSKNIKLALVGSFLLTQFNLPVFAQSNDVGSHNAGYGSGQTTTGAGRDAPREGTDQKRSGAMNTDENTTTRGMDNTNNANRGTSPGAGTTGTTTANPDTYQTTTTTNADTYVSRDADTRSGPSPWAIALMALVAIGLIAYFVKHKKTHGDQHTHQGA